MTNLIVADASPISFHEPLKRLGKLNACRAAYPKREMIDTKWIPNRKLWN